MPLEEISNKLPVQIMSENRLVKKVHRKYNKNLPALC